MDVASFGVAWDINRELKEATHTAKEMLNMQRTFSHIFRQGLKGEEKELEYIVITFLFNPYNPLGSKGWPRVALCD